MRSNGNLLSNKPPYRPQWRFKGVFAYPKHHDLEQQHKTRPHHNQKHNPPPRQPHLPKLRTPQPQRPQPRNRPHQQHPRASLPPPHQPANTLHHMPQNKNTNRSPARTTKETRTQTPTTSAAPRIKLKFKTEGGGRPESPAIPSPGGHRLRQTVRVRGFSFRTFLCALILLWWGNFSARSIHFSVHSLLCDRKF